ncbi:MAG: type II secretion system F family protein [Candidatus Omnitrophica bacterium]|nr:type II secretion system F family protein [Candidatus Omnitrophota bacterium]MBU4589778.1 type II secretion system F family protein [Candidatus Omnitrophota bacterium]
MPHFIYKAKKGPKEIIESKIEADSEASAIKQLIQQGYYPIWVKEVSSVTVQKRKPVKAKDLAIFTRQLSELLDSGLALYEALNIIENQIELPGLKEIIKGIREKVRDGNTFSESLKDYPRVFSNLYVNLVRSGEAGSMLRDVLNNIADFLEKEEDVKSRVLAALAYPMLMLIVGAGTIFILTGFVIPKLANMFVEMGEALPLPTRILIGFSDFIRNYWILLAIFVVGFVFFIAKTKPKGIIDRFKLKLPIIGALVKDSELARFSRTLSMLLKNGVAILSALKITSDVIENEVIKNETLRIYNDVREGSSLAAAIKKNTSFPQFIVNMATIGEEGGMLDKTLFKAAKSYELESDRKIKILSSLLEPAIILIMGVVVGFIVISMLLPVFQISLTAH